MFLLSWNCFSLRFFPFKFFSLQKNSKIFITYKKNSFRVWAIHILECVLYIWRTSIRCSYKYHKHSRVKDPIFWKTGKFLTFICFFQCLSCFEYILCFPFTVVTKKSLRQFFASILFIIGEYSQHSSVNNKQMINLLFHDYLKALSILSRQ